MRLTYWVANPPFCSLVSAKHCTASTGGGGLPEISSSDAVGGHFADWIGALLRAMSYGTAGWNRTKHGCAACTTLPIRTLPLILPLPLLDPRCRRKLPRACRFVYHLESALLGFGRVGTYADVDAAAAKDVSAVPKW
jgi:hypothetical protein